MHRGSRIYVAGHRGLVGSALFRRLVARGCTDILTRTHRELDLQRESQVEAFFEKQRPDYVLLAAARVGGIHANNCFPVDFLLQNLRIQNNVLESAWRFGVQGLLFLGSSCIYPKLAPQPLKEEYLLGGKLEPTNEAYAIAKIAGIELCEALNRQYGTRFLSVMPTNLFGPGDSYDLENSHVLPAFIRKFHLAKLASRGDWDAIAKDEVSYGKIPGDVRQSLAAIAREGGHVIAEDPDLHPNSDTQPAVRLWGTGKVRREFLYSDDLAAACVFLMENLTDVFATLDAAPSSSPASVHLINIGSGKDLTIGELAQLVAEVVGYPGPIYWDAEKPDGTPQKLLDISKIRELGWEPQVGLRDGIEMAYRDYLKRTVGPA